MKYLLFSVLTLTLTTLSIAQNSDKTNCGRIGYIQPPSNMVLQTFKTFYIDATVPDNNANYKQIIYDRINLPGFTRTEVRESADFIINYTMFPLVFEKTEESTQTSESEVNGVKTSKTTYSALASYQHKNTINVLLKDGTSVFFDERADRSIHNGEAADSKSAALTSFEKTKINSATDRLKEAIGIMRDKIIETYCYLPKTNGVDIITVKPKKFNYDNFNKGAELIKQAVAMQTADFLTPEEAKTLCKQAIDLWLVELKESDLVDKKARINDELTAALYYNIGIAYFICEDYSLAYENLLKASEFDKNVTGQHYSLTKDSKTMLDRAANKK